MRYGKISANYAVLWFDSNAEEAADFYVSVFKNSRRLDVLRVPADSAVGPKGKAR